MIAPLGKHFRKWLLGLAVAARNRVQAIIVGLESIEQEKLDGAGREIAPGDAKTARPGGPPDHWVQLVKRHAPELLQPAPAYAVTRASSPGHERNAALDEAVPEKATYPRSDGDATTRADLPLSSRAPKESADPGSQWQMPAEGKKRQTGDAFRMVRVSATSPEHFRDEDATGIPLAARPGSVKAGRPAVTSAGADKTLHRRTSGRESEANTVPAKGSQTGLREAQITDTRAVAGYRLQSTDGPIENSGAGATKRTNPPAIEPFAGRGEQRFAKVPGYETDLQVDTGKPVHGKINQASGYDSQPGPGGGSKGLDSPPGAGGKTPASQSTSGGDDLKPVSEVGLINGQRTASLPPQRETAAEKMSPPAELSWPSLPGEDDFEDVGESYHSAAWPVLPGERRAEVASPPDQTAPHAAQAESRTGERLRRLEEEQKGRSWSESHF